MALRLPNLGSAPAQYDQGFFSKMVSELATYFQRSNQPYPVNAATLNINTATLPTQTSLSTLRSGDVYVDTSAGNVLKVKP